MDHAASWSVECPGRDVGRGGELSNASTLSSVMDGVTRHMSMIAAKRLKLKTLARREVNWRSRTAPGRQLVNDAKNFRPLF